MVGERKMSETLEKQINKQFFVLGSISDWPGQPASSMMIPLRTDRYYCLWERIEKLIIQAPLEIALTSPSEYIREYRMWYEEQK